MSAYGNVVRAGNNEPTLHATNWSVDPGKQSSKFLLIYHLVLSTARNFPGLLDYLGHVFIQEVEDGKTYPQENVTLDSFEAYFFSADVFLGITHPLEEDRVEGETKFSIEEARAGRRWDECIAGYYYVKPNYPGRSSHICNAGFVVPPKERGKGYGNVLARSYLRYAPSLGYQASVFNLVYVNNVASVKMWERLGFTKAGRIPNAGRLRKKDGEGEEYVDAWVIYKSLLDV